MDARKPGDPGWDPPFIAAMYGAFREAAGWAAEYEFRLRLLADKTAPIAHVSLAKRAEEVEEAVLAHFERHISAEERDRVPVLRRLRNKLLHGEFTAARLHLEQLGFARRPAMIRVGKFVPGTLSAEVLQAALESAPAFAVEEAPDQGNLCAWHMQSAGDGSYAAVVDVIQSGIGTLNRLAELP